MPAPKFPKIPSSALSGAMKTFEGLLKEAQTPSGRVDVNKLRDKIEGVEVNDTTREALWSALDVIEDSFPRRGRAAGCGSGYAMNRAPQRLSSDEVTTVLGALAKARGSVLSGANKDGDSKIDAGEASTVLAKDDLPHKLLGSALNPRLGQYKRDLRVWNATISRLATKIEERANLDNRIGFVADYHAKTNLGAEAITWAYRLEAVKGYLGDTWSMAEDLSDADKNVMALVPLTKNDANRKNHLDDQEIKAFLGTGDLHAFIEETKAEIESELGTSYAEYLEGKDAPEPEPEPVHTSGRSGRSGGSCGGSVTSSSSSGC